MLLKKVCDLYYLQKFIIKLQDLVVYEEYNFDVQNLNFISYYKPNWPQLQNMITCWHFEYQNLGLFIPF